MNYRNPRLLELARYSPQCFCCGGHNDGSVVAAHANMQTMGKGMGHKAADIPAFVCARCHDDIDGRTTLLGKHEKEAAWAVAACRTMKWALENHPEVFNQKGKA